MLEDLLIILGMSVWMLLAALRDTGTLGFRRGSGLAYACRLGRGPGDGPPPAPDPGDDAPTGPRPPALTRGARA